MLYSLGVEEEQVNSLTGEMRRAVIEWARNNADSCYVPSWIVRDLGLRTRYDQ